MARTVSSTLLVSSQKGFVASRGLQVALEKPQKCSTTTTEVCAAPVTTADVYVRHAVTPPSSPNKHDVSVPSLVNGKVPGAVELFMGVVRLIQYSVSTLIPFGMSFQFSFRSTVAQPQQQESSEPEQELLAPHTLPEEREQAILRELCSEQGTSRPLIFSARSMESYLAARKATVEVKERRRSFDTTGLTDLTSHLSVDVQKALLQALDQYVLRPVSYNAWSRTTSIDMDAGAEVAPEPRKNDWARMSITVVGLLVVVDAVLLTVFALSN